MHLGRGVWTGGAVDRVCVDGVVCEQQGVWTGGALMRGVYTPSSVMATDAVSMHPSIMHSCLVRISLTFAKKVNQ